MGRCHWLGELCIISFLYTTLYYIHYNQQAREHQRQSKETAQSPGLDASGSQRSCRILGVQKAAQYAGIHVGHRYGVICHLSCKYLATLYDSNQPTKNQPSRVNQILYFVQTCLHTSTAINAVLYTWFYVFFIYFMTSHFKYVMLISSSPFT